MAVEDARADTAAPTPRSAGIRDGAGLSNGLPELLGAIDWDFADADTRHTGHGLHPYPAKFVPQIPETLIRLLTYPGELVLDCFGGSGTTAVEALRAGRRSISIDANPIANLITRVKTTRLSTAANQQLDTLRLRVQDTLLSIDDPFVYGRDKWRPIIPNMDRWYAPQVADELAAIRWLIVESLTEPARDVALLAFVTAATRVSYQDSETRYKSVLRLIHPGEPSKRFLSELQRLIRRLDQEHVEQDDLRLVRGDARSRCTYPVDANTVDLVVTSPPYPNAYDYHLYHRFRIYWLGNEPHELRRTEIGSHLTNQATTDAVGKYQQDMLAVLTNVADVLRPGRFAVFVVGDGVHHGEIYPTASALSSLASTTGLDTIACLSRRLPVQRRSVTVAGRRLNQESVLVLQKPDSSTGSAQQGPVYELFPYEQELAEREVNRLKQRSADAPLRHPRQAAFSYRVRWDNSYIETLQRFSEHDPARGQKKNSTYASHGLHRYKGKFYPQLAKALINITDPYGHPGVVCDPFGGSGTVAVEARMAGLDVLTIDQNPLAAAVAQAKINFLDLSSQQLKEAVRDVLKAFDGAQSAPLDWNQFADEVRVEVESWFAPRILAKLSHLLREIRRQVDRHPDYGHLVASILSAVASDLIRDISHQEPTDLRIRRRFEPLTDAPVSELFADRAQRMVERRRLLDQRLELGPTLGKAWVVQGDAAVADAYETEAGCAVDIACVVTPALWNRASLPRHRPPFTCSYLRLRSTQAS